MKALPLTIILNILCLSLVGQEPQRLDAPIQGDDPQQTAQEEEPRQIRSIELINAESMQFDKGIGEDARRLINDVIFKHEDAFMYCDSAYLYPGENYLEAFSNIHIEVGDSIDIYGDKLYYDGNSSIAELHGNVRMEDDEMILTTNHLIYDLNANTAQYYDGGKIVDKDNILTSKWGFYYADNKNLFFNDSVKLVNPEYVMDSDTLRYNTNDEIARFFGPTTIVSDENTIFCKNGWYDTKNDIAQFKREAFIHNNEQSITGDSLYYDRKKGYGKAIRNVIIVDTVQNAVINGHFGEHFENDGFSIVTEEAVLTIISDKDSLFLHADSLKYVFQDKPIKKEKDSVILPEQQYEDEPKLAMMEENPAEINLFKENNNDESVKNENNKAEKIRKVLAYNRGKFYRTDLQGISDSIVYNFNDSIIYMYHEPILWSQEHQLTAERIEVETWDNTVDKMHLYDAAFIISQEDSLNFNQIKGRRVVGHLHNNQLYKIDVFGNGETIYYVRDEDQELIGINKSISSNMTIYVDNNQVNQIVFRDNPEADLFPPGELSPEDKLLRHFHWFVDIRPKSKNDIFVWKNYEK